MSYAEPRPDPVPDGLDGEDMRQLAQQHSVDLTTGDYVESFDIEQMRDAGQLTEVDEGALKEADEAYARAEVYGNTLKAAMSCML